MRKKLFWLLIPLLLFVMTACKPVLPLSCYEEWLGSLDGTEVTEISVESGYIGVAPGTPTTIRITEDREEIERLVNAWKGVTLAVDISAPTGGGSFQEITFTLEDGTTYTVYSGNGKYTVEGLRFTLSAFPTIAEDKITRVESGPKADPEFAPYYEYVGNMKGIEIYCWEKDGAWECCLMPGTNRLKTVEEVRYLQENYPCPIAQMKIILRSYSEEEREYACVAIVSTPPVQSELAHGYDGRNEAKYLEVYTLLGLGG